MNKLWLVPGQGKPIELVAGSPITLGRDGSVADVVLEDISTSRIHAVISSEAGQWMVTDKRSSNGVFVNGKRVARAVLEDGIELRFGALRFQVASSAPVERGEALRLGSAADGAQVRVVVPAAQRVVAAAIEAAGGLAPPDAHRPRSPGSTMRLEKAMALLGVEGGESRQTVRQRHQQLRADLEEQLAGTGDLVLKMQLQRRIRELDVAAELLAPENP